MVFLAGIIRDRRLADPTNVISDELNKIIAAGTGTAVICTFIICVF